MRNRTYGGVRGRKTKVGGKLLRFPPTRFLAIKIDRRLKSLVYVIRLILFSQPEYPSDSGINKIWGRYRRKPTERRAGMKVSSVWSLLLTRT